jgi:uncharacterized protein DUF488
LSPRLRATAIACSSTASGRAASPRKRSGSTTGSRSWRRARRCENGSATIRRWEEFRARYFRELDGQGPALEALARRAVEGQVTLVFAARDSERNNAVALKDYLERRR